MRNLPTYDEHLDEARKPRTVEQTVDALVKDMVSMGADEKTARGMYQPADASAFKGYALASVKSHEHRRGVAWSSSVTKDGKVVCGVDQAGLGGDNSYDVVDQQLYRQLQSDARRAFPRDPEAVDTFVSLLDSMANESRVAEAVSPRMEASREADKALGIVRKLGGSEALGANERKMAKEIATRLDNLIESLTYPDNDGN